jgi:cytochrome c oxidase subunit III
MNANAAAREHPHDAGGREPPREIGQLGMWVFIASEILFFGGLFVAYVYGRSHWPNGFAQASRHTDVVLGTLNTGVLLTSSAVIALAVACAESPAFRRWTARLLWLTAALGVIFIVIKGMEYRKEWHEHLFPGPGFELDAGGAQLFFMLYFVMTALHALHLAIGIVGVSLFAWATGQAKSWAPPRRIDIMALYWHFVDVVWIFLYPLLYLVERHS